MSKPIYNQFSTFFKPEIQGVEVEGTAQTSTFTIDKFGTDRYFGVWIYLDLTVAGTSPTLDVKMRAIMPTGTDADPYSSSQPIQIAAKAQITSTGKSALAFLSSANNDFTDATATLAAGTIKTVHLPAYCDITFVIGGTSPSFTFNKLRVILSR